MADLKPCPKCGDCRCPSIAAIQHTFSWEIKLFCPKSRCSHSIVGRGITHKIALKKAEKAWNKYSPVQSVPSIDAVWY